MKSSEEEDRIDVQETIGKTVFEKKMWKKNQRRQGEAWNLNVKEKGKEDQLLGGPPAVAESKSSSSKPVRWVEVSWSQS